MTSLNNTEQSIISSQELEKHNMKKYEFKKLDTSIPPPNAANPTNLAESKPQDSAPSPTPSQVSMIQSSIEKELIDKLLAKSDGLANTLSSFQEQFEKLQSQSSEKEKIAREEGFKEGELKAQLNFQDDMAREKERVAKSIIALDETIEGVKAQINKLESELSAIAIDIAKEVIIKEIDENSAKIAAHIAKELLQSMGGNLNVIIKVNPLDFDYLNNLIKNSQNVKLKSDDAIAKGGVVIISDNGNIDGNVMSRYKILKQSVLENLRDEF